MAKTYKAAPTNVNKGNKTHGSFKNSGQKPGYSAPKKISKGKEKLAAKDPVDAKLRRISKSVYNRQKAMNNDAAQRAQLNG